MAYALNIPIIVGLWRIKFQKSNLYKWDTEISKSNTWLVLYLYLEMDYDFQYMMHKIQAEVLILQMSEEFCRGTVPMQC